MSLSGILKRRAFTGIEVLIALAALGVGVWALKPAILPGQSRRAAQSTAATTRVEQVAKAQGGAVAASVVKMAEANAEAPPSPSRDFIAAEAPAALALLPAPDAAKLIEAERRRAAVMEGRVDEARKLYEAAAKQASLLQRERDEALSARRAADLALERTAAAEHARNAQMLGLGLLAGLALVGWAYSKIYGIAPTTLGAIAADLRAGHDPIHALDVNLPPWLHGRIARAAKLAAPTE